MIPKKIAKTSESSHQQAFFCYCAVAYRYGFDIADKWAETGGELPGKVDKPAIPALEWIHAIPNGGFRDKITAGKLKAEGVKSGISDIFLPYPVDKWHGLYIEMKKPALKPKTNRSKKGGLTNDQISFANYLSGVDYGFVVCYSYSEAIEVVKQYINYKS